MPPATKAAFDLRTHEPYINSCVALAQEKLRHFPSIAEIALREKDINRYPRLEILAEPREILVAYRGSQCDQGALEFIAPLFARQKPEITILHVQETELGETPEFAESCLLTGEETLKHHGFTPIKKMTQGDFVDEILKAVAVERYDLLVLGAYGHNRPKYLKMISDEALNLVRLTTRPVLVYRDKSEM